MNMQNMQMMGMNMNMGNNLQFGMQPRNMQQTQSLFSEQVNKFKTVKDEPRPDAKAVYPLKRSAYHVAISYKIYLDKLKREGRSF